MVLTPRILYGLHERFVLFPYERGARRSKLVLRCNALRTFCESGVLGEAVQIGAPLVLGELLDGDIAQNAFVPVVYTGRQLNALKTRGATWAIRNHRAQPFAERSVRFETGTKTTYGTYTAYFALRLLLELTKGCPHEANSHAGLPPGR
jgi:hypothetical protein